MTELAAKLLQDALALPEEERVKLAEFLWQSVEPNFAHESDPEWQAMITRRREELRSGKVKPISLEQLRQEAFGETDESVRR